MSDSSSELSAVDSDLSILMDVDEKADDDVEMSNSPAASTNAINTSNSLVASTNAVIAQLRSLSLAPQLAHAQGSNKLPAGMTVDGVVREHFERRQRLSSELHVPVEEFATVADSRGAAPGKSKAAATRRPAEGEKDLNSWREGIESRHLPGPPGKTTGLTNLHGRVVVKDEDGKDTTNTPRSWYTKKLDGPCGFQVSNNMYRKVETKSRAPMHFNGFGFKEWPTITGVDKPARDEEFKDWPDLTAAFEGVENRYLIVCCSVYELYLQVADAADDSKNFNGIQWWEFAGKELKKPGEPEKPGKPEKLGWVHGAPGWAYGAVMNSEMLDRTLQSSRDKEDPRTAYCKQIKFLQWLHSKKISPMTEFAGTYTDTKKGGPEVDISQSPMRNTPITSAWHDLFLTPYQGFKYWSPPFE